MSVIGNKTDVAVAGGIETLQASLVNIINQATTGVQAGMNFLSEQMPDVIHQLLVWKLTQNLFWFVILSIFTILLFTFCYKMIKAGQKKKDYNADGYYFAGFMIGIVGCGTLIASLVSINEALLIWLAPKIYLIEYAAKLIKGK